jgi:threonine/homoserine/homoserine lactone efflux protein
MRAARPGRTVRVVLVFLAACVALVAIPGPNVLFVLARGLAGGRRAAVVSVLGVEAATACFVGAAAFGLTALLVSSAIAFAVVRYAGAAYLLVLAVRALRSGAAVEPAAVPAGRTFRQAFLVGISNPKVAVFFLAFLPQFVDPGSGWGPLPFLLLGGLFVTGGTLWCALFALGAATASAARRRSPRLLVWLERLSGCVYIALGLNLLRSRPQPA